MRKQRYTQGNKKIQNRPTTVNSNIHCKNDTIVRKYCTYFLILLRKRRVGWTQTSVRNYHYHQIILLLVEHRASMKSFQALRPPAIPLISFHDLLVFLILSSIVLRHVLFGLPYISFVISQKNVHVILYIYFFMHYERLWTLRRHRRRWVDNIRTELQELGYGYLDWIGLAQDRDRWRTLVSAVMNLRVPWNAGNFLTSCKPVTFSRRTLHRGVSK